MKTVLQNMVRLFKPAILVRFIALALTDVISVMMAVNLGNLMSTVLDQRPIGSNAVIQICTLFILEIVICPFFLFLSNKMIFRLSIDGEEAIFKGVLNQNPVKLESIDAGELSTKIIDDGITLRWAIIDFWVNLLNCIVMLAILGWFLVRISFQYTLIILMLVLCSYGKSILFGPVLARQDLKLLRAAQSIKAKMLEAASSIHYLSINKLTPIIRESLCNDLSSYSSGILKHTLFLRSALKYLSEFFDHAVYLIILLSGTWLAKTGRIHIGTILIMSSYYVLLSKQFSNIDTIIKSKKLIQGVSEDLAFALNQPFEPCQCAFSCVTVKPFRYLMSDKSIRCPDGITIRRAEKIAIIGGNGVGKTTLLHLLIGLKDCDEIKRHLDEVPCGKGNLKWLVSYVDMNSNSLADIVESYVLSGKKAVELDGILNAIKTQCDLFPIWQQNTDTLSGGQRKRADLARTLLEKKHILALDEPEVGLDQCWKERIANMISSSDQTVIFTTHDPLFTAVANKIIQIDNSGNIHILKQ